MCHFDRLSGALATNLTFRQIQPAQALQRRLRAQPLHPEQHGRAEKQAASRTHGQESGKQGFFHFRRIRTEWMEWMWHRKRRETKQQPSMLSGPAVPSCGKVSFRYLCDIHSIHSVS